MNNKLNISIRRIGACGFDILILSEDKELQCETMGDLDHILTPIKDISVFPWSEGADVGVSYRYLSGCVKTVQGLLNNWLKVCQKKFGNKLDIDKAWQ